MPVNPSYAAPAIEALAFEPETLIALSSCEMDGFTIEEEVW
jgi:hypothetical protein